MPPQSLRNNGKKDHELTFKQTGVLHGCSRGQKKEKAFEGCSSTASGIKDNLQGPLTRAIFHVILEAISVASGNSDVCFCTLVATKSHVDDMGDFKSHLYGPCTEIKVASVS